MIQGTVHLNRISVLVKNMSSSWIRSIHCVFNFHKIYSIVSEGIGQTCKLDVQHDKFWNRRLKIQLKSVITWIQKIGPLHYLVAMHLFPLHSHTNKPLSSPGKNSILTVRVLEPGLTPRRIVLVGNTRKALQIIFFSRYT